MYKYLLNKFKNLSWLKYVPKTNARTIKTKKAYTFLIKCKINKKNNASSLNNEHSLIQNHKNKLTRRKYNNTFLKMSLKMLLKKHDIKLESS